MKGEKARQETRHALGQSRLRAPMAFLFGFLCCAYLGFTGLQLGWLLAALIVLLAVAHRFAESLSRAFGGSAGGWARRFSREALAALVLLAALYVFSREPFVGLLAFIALLYLLAGELVPGGGSASEIRSGIEETAVALDTALGLWLLLSLSLGTASPLNVVTSCSMRPALDRGDMIILQGGAVKAPLYSTDLPLEQLRVTVRRGECLVNGQSAPCDRVLEVGGQEFQLSTENDVVVYVPEPRITDLIIHRAALAIDAAGKNYYLTKGDNNQFLDQPAIRPVSESQVQGKVLLRIPLVGYLKLLMFMQFDNPEGCDTEVRQA